ncbi:unnamed protein product [Caenorhabditis angaria]|uniref:Tyrosine-protein phosphatase domain-containing protein n=1 Tax=Caenorhabditis angaria TaxID=860376 RepID=A0A9P1IGW9_9PELO|nr:unnamed protein product [Caenorhabditis angaria]
MNKKSNNKPTASQSQLNLCPIVVADPAQPATRSKMDATQTPLPPPPVQPPTQVQQPTKIKLTARIGQLLRVGKKDKNGKRKGTSKQDRPLTTRKSDTKLAPITLAEEKTCKSYRKTKQPNKRSPSALRTQKTEQIKPKSCGSQTSLHIHPVSQRELPDKPAEFRPVSVEKVEKSCQNLLEQLGSKSTNLFEDQWEYIDDVDVEDADIQAFLSHIEDYNQAEDVEVLDGNRVKLDKTETKRDDYIHASYVEIKDISRKFVLAQLPLLNSKRLEDFWTMIYQEKLHNIYLICHPEDSAKSIDSDKFSEYFPLTSGHHEHYEQIWVHNRKVESGSLDGDLNDQFIIEVLPNGCAESILVTIHLLNYWPTGDIPLKPKRILNSATNVFGAADAYEGDPIGIISKRGAGRPGTFLAIVCAIQMMKNGQNLDLKELCRSIRKQRPGGIDTYFQFVSIYSTILQFAAQYVNKDMKAGIEKIERVIDLIMKQKGKEDDDGKSKEELKTQSIDKTID